MFGENVFDFFFCYSWLHFNSIKHASGSHMMKKSHGPIVLCKCEQIQPSSWRSQTLRFWTVPSVTWGQSKTAAKPDYSVLTPWGPEALNTLLLKTRSGNWGRAEDVAKNAKKVDHCTSASGGTQSFKIKHVVKNGTANRQYSIFVKQLYDSQLYALTCLTHFKVTLISISSSILAVCNMWHHFPLWLLVIQ